MDMPIRACRWSGWVSRLASASSARLAARFATFGTLRSVADREHAAGRVAKQAQGIFSGNAVVEIKTNLQWRAPPQGAKLHVE
jgi:hypothetical protein